ncbi:MAG: glycosyltransferase [Propionibacteriaceae bacterium]|jgi:glycosyltransferase involved in cell wall biosynthesis|nr:glycosyltransferase [Propionibacteriaceae bacterium]
MKLSFLLPVHNRADLLPATIGSLLTQTMPADDYEIIVVDDHSSDGSADVAQQLLIASGHPHHRVIHLAGRARLLSNHQVTKATGVSGNDPLAATETPSTLVNPGNLSRTAAESPGDDPGIAPTTGLPSGGASTPRNLALRHARGDWVFFVDSDDLVAPELAERLWHWGQAHHADIVALRYDDPDRPMLSPAGGGQPSSSAAPSLPASPGRLDHRTADQSPPVGPLDRRDNSTTATLTAALPVPASSLRPPMAFASRGNRARADLLADHWLYATMAHKGYRRSRLLASGVRFDESLALYEDLVFNIDLLFGRASADDACLPPPRLATLADQPYYHLTDHGGPRLHDQPQALARTMAAFTTALDRVQRSPWYDDATRQQVAAVLINRWLRHGPTRWPGGSATPPQATPLTSPVGPLCSNPHRSTNTTSRLRSTAKQQHRPPPHCQDPWPSDEWLNRWSRLLRHFPRAADRRLSRRSRLLVWALRPAKRWRLCLIGQLLKRWPR